jgi:hypothetical protein
MMEKCNVVEEGRTPKSSAAISEIIDEGVEAFMKKTGDVKPEAKPKETPDEEGKRN